MRETPQTPPTIAERIIRARGVRHSGREAMHNDEDRYEAFIATEGFPQMGFSLFCRQGRRHGFLFHNLDNLDLIERQHGQYLTFTHRGKAVTMRGRGLHDLFDAILDHTLQAVYEYEETIWPQPGDDEPIVDRVQVTALPNTAPPRGMDG